MITSSDQQFPDGKLRFSSAFAGGISLLCWSIIPVISMAAHTLSHSVAPQPLAERMTGILAITQRYGAITVAR